MLLRLVIVGLVASLGFELPTGRDLRSWGQQGRSAWDQVVSCCQIRTTVDGDPADLETLEPADSTPAADEALAADRAFEGIVGAMAASFAEPAPAVEAVAVAFEPAEVGDDLYPGLAYELNRASEGAPAPLATVAEPQVEPAGRSERLVTAVRLTGQAVHAWASLLRQGAGTLSLHQ